MRKIILSIVMCISLLLPMGVSAEEYEISILLNGEKLEVPVAPKLVNDRTMLPMRAIFEALNAQVTWIGEEQLIFAAKDDLLIVLKIGEPVMSVQRAGTDENRTVKLDTAPFIENDSTLVPVRAVAEALEAKVDWEQETRTVIIVTE